MQQFFVILAYVGSKPRFSYHMQITITLAVFKFSRLTKPSYAQPMIENLGDE